MPFINGVATGEDVKLPLFLIEPYQLSDLVAVPAPTPYAFGVIAINNDAVPQSGHDFAVNDVNYFFTPDPLLFQRFNPYGTKFADGYSTKVYNWLRKYSAWALRNKSPLLKFPEIRNPSFDYISHDIGRKLKVKLPNNGKKINLTYYYPELYSEDMYFRFGEDYITITPDQFSDWRTLTYPDGSPINQINKVYRYPKIQNECMLSFSTRSWLINSQVYFCKGQEIEIDEDILIASLIIDYGDLEDSDINDINSQIPKCYFYKYLDTFLDLIDSAIIRKHPNAFDIQQATAVDYTISFDYEIDHFNNSVENLADGQIYQSYTGEICQEKYHFFTPHPDNKYSIKAQGENRATVSIRDYTPLNSNYKFGAIYYANNNFWNNYDFEDLVDDGECQLSFRNEFRSYEEWNEININYFGQYTYFDQIGQINKNGQVRYYGDVEAYRFNTFYPNGLDVSEGNYIDAFELKRGYREIASDIYQNDFTRILYSSAAGFPDFYASIGNSIEEILSTEPHSEEGGSYLVRAVTKKLFRTKIDVTSLSIDFNNQFENRISPTHEIETYSDINSIGEIVYEYDKYGILHPEARRASNTTGEEFCQQVKYYQEPVISYSLPEETISTGEPILQYGDYDNFGKLKIEGWENISYLDLGKRSFNLDTSFQASGTFTKTYTANLVPDNKTKKYIPFNDSDKLFTFINSAHARCTLASCDLEDLKKWVREIWLSLDAEEYAYLEGTEDTSRVWSLGKQIEAIATVLGLSFNSDGSIRSIRQGELIKQGDSIPAGWNFGQFGRNRGGSSSGQSGGSANETRYGVAYEVRSNTFTNDDFTGDTNAIEQGGVVLCENIPQLLHFVLQDLDRALNLQDMGANVLPTPNGEIASYQGLNPMLLDVLFSLGQLSRQISGTHVLAMKNQAILQELLSGLGLPVVLKELEVTTGDGQAGKLPYPGYGANAPTLQDLNAVVLLNLAATIGGKVSLTPPQTSTDEEEAT